MVSWARQQGQLASMETSPLMRMCRCWGQFWSTFDYQAEAYQRHSLQLPQQQISQVITCKLHALLDQSLITAGYLGSSRAYSSHHKAFTIRQIFLVWPYRLKCLIQFIMAA